MNDAGIVRNRAKIEGAILSARGYLDIMEKGPGFSTLLWNFVDGEPQVNHRRGIAEVPAETPVSRAISKELASRGFKFVGPTIVYAFMQAVGMVNDHLVKCYCHPDNRDEVRGCFSPAPTSGRQGGSATPLPRTTLPPSGEGHSPPPPSAPARPRSPRGSPRHCPAP